MPELPAARKQRFVSRHGLPAYDAELLTSRKDVADYFESAVKIHDNPKALSNWIVGDLFRVLKDARLDEQLYIENWPIPATHLAELVRLIDQDKINGKIAKSVFEAMLNGNKSPQQIVSEKGLEQVSDAGSIEAAMDQVFAANGKQVEQYRSGNDKVFGFIVGQIMKATQGKANPQKVNEILREKLKPQDNHVDYHCRAALRINFNELGIDVRASGRKACGRLKMIPFKPSCLSALSWRSASSRKEKLPSRTRSAPSAPASVTETAKPFFSIPSAHRCASSLSLNAS